MPIQVTCPSCHRSGRVPDNAAGKVMQCPACGTRTRLPAAKPAADGLEILDDDAPDADGLEILDDASGADGLEILDDIPPPPKPAKKRPQQATLAWPTRDAESRAPAPPAPAAPPAAPSNANLYLGVGIGVGAMAFLGVMFWFVSAIRSTRTAPEEGKRAPAVVQSSPAQPAPELSAPGPRPEPATVPDVAATPGPEGSSAADLASLVEVPAEPDFATAARNSAVATPTPTPAATAPARPPVPAGGVLSTAEIVERYEPSIALIKGKAGSGTGFLVAPGLLATNAHVIDDEFIGHLEVRFPSAREGQKGPVSAELLYEDAKRDLAFLAVKTDLPPLQVASSYQYRKGEDVTVIGNPGVDGQTVLENAISRGVMSTKAELDGLSYYQLGVAVNPGNSGGPVFGSTGQVIGVVTLRIAGKEELSFCIPVEELRAAMTRVAAQSSNDGAGVRSRHRLKNVYKNLSTGGAIYGVGLELGLVARAKPQDAEIAERAKKLDEAVPEIEKTVLFNLVGEANGLRNDPLIVPSTRRKVGELASSFQQLKDAYSRGRGATPLDATRNMKATHRRLVTELAPLLKIEVPSGLMALLEDHIATTDGPTVATTVPVAPGSAFRARMWERHGIAPPPIPGQPGVPPSSPFRRVPRGPRPFGPRGPSGSAPPF